MAILAMRRLFLVAMDLGKTSPKTSIRKVIPPVAIPTAKFGNVFMARVVARAAAPTLTRLFPIKMVVRSVWGSAFNFLIRKEDFFPSLDIWMALVLLMEKSAVSADEKKPDRMIKNNRVNTWSVMMAASLPCSHGDAWTKRTIDNMFFVRAGIKMGLARFVTSS